MSHARRAGLAIVLALVAGGVVLAALPRAAAGVRWGGVALLWWYGLLVAPLAAAVVTLALASRRAPGPAAGLWTSPALLLPLATHTFAGGPAAPLAGLAAAVAPLVAALAPVRGPTGLPRTVVAAVVSASAALVVAANVRVVAEVTAALGGAPGVGAAVAAVAALLALAVRARAACAVLPGVLALAAALVGVALATAMTPAGAWRVAASRPAIVFPERSPWLTEGGLVRAPTTLTVAEPQRLWAASASTWRLHDGDGGGLVRDWPVSAGDAVPLRPGDTVTLPAGARVRFEAGRRVPGASASGPAWADDPGRGAAGLLSAVGATVTLLAGAAALLGRSAGSAPAGGALLGAGAALLAAGWGIYAAAAAPDLRLAGLSAAPFVGLPGAVAGSGGRMLAAVLVGALALLLAAALGVAADLGGRAGPGRRAGSRTWWLGAAVVAGGFALSWTGLAPWRALGLGLGLAGSVLVPPALVQGDGPRRAAALTGFGAFAALAAAGAALAAPAAVFDYPALVAAPLGWAAGWVAAARRG